MADATTRVLRGFGVLSALLAAPLLLRPERSARATGVEDGADEVVLLRLVGAREAVVAGGLLATPSPWWQAARVAGDAMDLPLALLARRRASGARRSRLTVTAAALGVIGLADVLGAVAAFRSREDTTVQVNAAVTIRRTESEIREALRTAEVPLSLDTTTIDLRPAPGDRGVEVRVAARAKQPGGLLGSVIRGIGGVDPERRLSDALRRFKQVMETGEVVRSDSNPEGLAAPRARTQLPASPNKG